MIFYPSRSVQLVVAVAASIQLQCGVGLRVRISGVSGQGLVLRFGIYAFRFEFYGLNGGI